MPCSEAAWMMRVLDSPELRETVFPVSVDFYHEAGRTGLIGKDVELLQGVMFRKIPKSPLHQTLIRLLQHMLAQVVPIEFFVDRECPITCADSEPEPDLAVFVGSWKDYREKHPETAEMVIEVAITTSQRDRSKAAIYAAAGVKEYWVIEPEAGTVTQFTMPSADGYGDSRTYRAQESASSTVFPAFSLTLADLLQQSGG